MPEVSLDVSPDHARLDSALGDIPKGYNAGHGHDLPFHVELWATTIPTIEEGIALVGDHAVARAAFAEAVQRRPGKLVTLRQRTPLVADSRRH